jgi:hypothetical protein
MFVEMRAKKLLITREVSKNLILCFSVIKFLNNNFRIEKYKNIYDKKKFFQKLKSKYKNIKILY